MTYLETFFYVVGLVTTLCCLWTALIKHIFYGLKVGYLEARDMLFLDLKTMKDWSEFDKLWLVPRAFVLWFCRGVSIGLEGGEFVRKNSRH